MKNAALTIPKNPIEGFNRSGLGTLCSGFKTFLKQTCSHKKREHLSFPTPATQRAREFIGFWFSQSFKDISERQLIEKFYDNGKLVGEGGAYIKLTQYVDKATGAPMTEPDIFYPGVGFCRK